MGSCMSSQSIVGTRVPVVKEHLSDANGSGHFYFGPDKISATYALKQPSSPDAHAKLAKLERELFKVACENKKLDFKPRENIQKHFLQHNTIADHGRIPTPPPRITMNDFYQYNINKGNARV